jgi:hypothetical protein
MCTKKNKKPQQAASKGHKRFNHHHNKIASSDDKNAQNLYRQELSNIPSQERNRFLGDGNFNSTDHISHFHIKIPTTTHLVPINEVVHAATRPI